jgi:hypothetical protein
MTGKIYCLLGVAVVLIASPFALGATKTLDFESSAYCTNASVCADSVCDNKPVPPLFNRPGYGFQTSQYLVAPAACGEGGFNGTLGNDSFLTEGVVIDLRSNELNFSWQDQTNENSWVRVPAYSAGGVTPKFTNPTVYIGDGGSVEMSIALFGTNGVAPEEANPTGQLEFSLAIRETGLNLPLGVDGGGSGTVEFVGVTSGTTDGVTGAITATMPVGGTALTTAPDQFSISFHTIKWTFIDTTVPADGKIEAVDISVDGGAPVRKSIAGFSGDGILSAPFSRGALCDLAIRKPVGDMTKKWYVWVDNIVLDSAGLTEPVAIQLPLNTIQTSVTVNTIDAAATQVDLYVTPSGGSRTHVATHYPPFTDAKTTFDSTDGVPLVGGFLRLGDSYTATQTIDGVESGDSAPGIVQNSAIVLDNFDTYTSNAQFRAAWPYYSGNTGSFPPVLDINNVFQTCPNAVKAPGGTGATSTPERRIKGFSVMQGTDAIPLWIQWKTYLYSASGTASGLFSCGRYYLQLQNGTSWTTTYIGLGTYSATSYWNWVYKGSGSFTDSGVAVTFNTWHTMAIRITDANFTFYVDGTQVGQTARSGYLSGGISAMVLAGPYGQGSASKPTPDTWFDSISANYGASPVDANPPQTPMVTLYGPLPVGATTVTVGGVDAAASAITVYDGTSVIGSKTTGITAGDNQVTVTGLVSGHSIQASQTVSPLGESCLSAPIVVGSCSPVPAVGVAGPLVVGQTTVTVTGVKTSEPYPATTVQVYANGALIGSAAAAGANTPVPVAALVAGQTIKAAQTCNTIEGCAPASGPIVGSGTNAALYLTLCIKEAAHLNPPNPTPTIGSNGTGVGEAWEWIGATTRIGDGPVGKPISPSPNWQTVTFDPGTDPIMQTSLGAGNGALDGTYGIIEHLGITTSGADTGPYALFIDNVENSGVTFGMFEDPPYAAGTNNVMFAQPSFSGTTNGNIWNAPASVNYTKIDATQHDGAGAQSDKVVFQFIDNAASRWIRLTTAGSTGGLSYPVIDLTKPTTFRVLLAPAPTVTSIAPGEGQQNTTVSVTVGGTNFIVGGTQVALRMAGQTDIAATNVVVDPGNLSLTADLPLAGAALGKWDVVVTTVSSATLSQAFEVKNACAPPAVTSITPNQAVQGFGNPTVHPPYGNPPTVGPVHVTIAGSGFAAGATVKLVQGSKTAPVVSNVVVVDANTITADIDLVGATPNAYAPGAFDGAWDVVVTTCADGTLAGGFTVSMCMPTRQDSDGDGDVDLSDFGVFQGCFNGPNRPFTGPPVDQRKCACFDVGDNPTVPDVDLADFGAFQSCFNGPNRAPACNP